MSCRKIKGDHRGSESHVIRHTENVDIYLLGSLSSHWKDTDTLRE